MSQQDWIATDCDHELFDRELDSFVPDIVFDAHAHLYHGDHFPSDHCPVLLRTGPRVAGFQEFLEQMKKITPRRETAGLFFGFPHAHVDVAAENAFLHEQLQLHSHCCGQMLITPTMDAELIRETCRRDQFVGLKCYHVWSPCPPTFDSLIEHYLPESHVQVAHQEGLSITLHIVRSRALADSANQETIRRYCQRYPGMRLILAHAARGFNAHHTIEGIHALRGIDNVWFDTSAVTDCGAIEAIIRTMGHQKVLYGSDFPVSHMRGRCVALGDSFLWISADNTNLSVPYGDLQLAFVGHESLRTLKIAVMSTGLSDEQTEDIFYNNARALFPKRA